jgi:hypothetical protein
LRDPRSIRVSDRNCRIRILSLPQRIQAREELPCFIISSPSANSGQFEIVLWGAIRSSQRKIHAPVISVGRQKLFANSAN